MIGGEFHKIVEKLPEEVRETLALLCLEGLTQSQAATILGVSRGTVRARWRKALEFLRQQPGDDAYPDEDEWERLNKRRVELIDKEAEVGLSKDELGELERLQEETGKRLNRIAPLPFETLERFEERARRAGIPLD
jgi:transposase-like protein